MASHYLSISYPIARYLFLKPYLFQILLYITVKEKEILRKQGINDSYEVKILDKNKKLKTWLISGAPNYNEEGKVVGSIGVHLDITEQKEQEERP